MDILDYFQADLDALRALIFELKVAEENSPEEAQAFTALVSLVKSQVEAQEAILIPLETRSPHLQKAIRATLGRWTGSRDVEEMIECCTNISTWRSSLNIYCELLERQLWKQSEELLPVLFDELPSKERQKIGQIYRKLRGFGKLGSTSKDWRSIWASVINRAG